MKNKTIRIEADLSGVYIYRPLGHERVFLPLCKVADTPFHIQGDNITVCLYKHTKSR